MISRTLIAGLRAQMALNRQPLLKNVVKSSLVGPLVRNSSHGHGEVDIMDPKLYPPGYHPATMDEFPVPQGSWSEHNAKLQAKYNRHLVVGLLFFFGTLYWTLVHDPIDFQGTPASVGKNPPLFSARTPGITYKGPNES